MNPIKLRLPEQLLALARQYLQFGRDQQALRLLKRIIATGGLPARLAEETQVLLAELYLRHGRYRQARRHLRILISQFPKSARYHHLMARSHEDDPEGEVRTALRHYRRALDLDPEQPEHWCDFGLCLIACSDMREGIERLEGAVERSPGEHEYVRPLAMNLLDQDRPEDASRAVLHAMFRNPDDHRLKQLWNQVKFHEARRLQGRGLEGERRVKGGPVLLPFAVTRGRRRKAAS